MTASKTLTTAEDLLRMPSDCGRYELIHGKLVEMSPAGARHNKVMGKVTFQLLRHVEPLGLGEVLPGDTGVILARNPDHVLATDVCFISAARVPEGDTPAGYLEIVPDLVVEVVSPGDSAAKVRQKTEEWLQAGARLVWTFYPVTRTVAVSETATGTRVYSEAEMLNGEPVLPGFSVSVSAFFS